MLKKYKVGIVGCGRIASLYESDKRAKRFYPYLTHAGTFSKHPRTTVTCACDTNAKRLAQFGKRWKVNALYRDYREMLKHEELDILSICTPVESHVEIIERAAGHVRLIFCEKPLATSLKQVIRANSVCTRNGCLLAVNSCRQFDPSHRRIGALIRKGRIGQIRRVSCYYGKGLYNMGSHLVSLLLGYFGEMDWVVALNNVPTTGHGEFTPDFYGIFQRDIPCVAQTCNFRDYRIFEVDILGERGRITIVDEGLTVRSFKAATNRAETGARELRATGGPLRSTVGHALYWAVDNLAAALDGSQALLSAGKDYIAVQRVLDALAKSWQLGGAKVAINIGKR